MMYQFLLIVFGLLWIFSAVCDYSEFCYLWQLKGYLFKRFRDFLFTAQGKSFILSYRILWRSILATGLFFSPTIISVAGPGILFVVFGCDALYNIYRLVQGKLRRPTFTKTSIGLLFLALSLEVLLVYTNVQNFLYILFPFRFFLLSGIVGLLYIPREIVAAWFKQKAKQKLDSHPKLIVISITGSYGKSTVKVFLHTLLQKKYRVISTPENTNTDLGIAKFVLRTNFDAADIFIVEIGAYREHHVDEVCKFVKPAIGILTAINEQHISLFGSIEKTQKTKFELLRSLPKTGLAVVNVDNTYCRELIPTLQSVVKTFGTKEEYHPSCFIRHIETTEKGIAAEGQLDGTSWAVHLPVVGEHQAMNLAPCLIVATHLGLGMKDIQEAAQSISLPPHGLHTYTYGESTIIDDTYSSNPAGFEAALQVLASFPDKQKRIVITRGMMELGSLHEALHHQLGERIQMVAQELIVITKDAWEPLKKSVEKKKDFSVKLIEEPEALLRYLQEKKGSKNVILLENRLPSVVAEELQKQKK